MLEATQSVGEEFTIQQQNIEEMSVAPMSADKFVCTNCGECFAEVSVFMVTVILFKLFLIGQSLKNSCVSEEDQSRGQMI